MENSPPKKEPGTGSYIMVWLLAAVATKILAKILEVIFFMYARSMEEVIQASLYSMPVSIIGTAALIIGVYSLFPRLDVAKVIPYFWGLGAFAIIVSIAVLGTTGGYVPPIFYAMMIAEFVLTVLAVIWGFKKLGRL